MADINNPIHYSDLFVPDDSLNNLIKQLNEVADAYQFAANLINGQAQKISASLTSVSGATEEGRKAIFKASAETDKLAKAQHALAVEESEVAKQLALLKQATHEQATLNKLAAKEANSAADSYNALSAQYSRNKIIINSWSKAQREANKDFIQQTKEIYERMKEMQAETGKMQLNVGNYGDAAKGLRTELRDLVQQMAALQMQGQGNSAEYAELAKKAGVLRDAMSDATQAVSRMASDTSQLDTIMAGLTAASGGFTALTGALTMFGGESEDVAEAQKQLQSVMAITMGLTRVQTAFQKQSALMLGISKAQTYALAKAEAYERLIKIKGTAATKGATIAQTAFNAVANANPYVLLATALITVVGALWAFSKGSKSAAEEQKRLNEQQALAIDIHLRLVTIIKEQQAEEEKDAENAVALAKASGASIEEVREAEDKLYNLRKQHHNERMQQDAEALNNEDKNRENIQKTLQLIEDLNKRDKNAKVTITIDGKRSKMKVSEAIDQLQEWVDNKQKSVDVAVNLRTEGRDLAAEAEQRAAERAKEDAERYKAAKKAELQALRDAEQAKIANIENSYEQQRATIEAAGRKEIEDLRNRLKTEENLTTTARNAIKATIVEREKKTARELKELAEKQAKDVQAIRWENENARIAMMKDSEAKELKQSQTTYLRQREELEKQVNDTEKYTIEERRELGEELALLDEQQEQKEKEIADKWNLIRLNAAKEATQLRLESAQEGSEKELALRLQLIEQERQAELAANKNATEANRKSEADINAKYDKQETDARTKYWQDRIEMEYQFQREEIDLADVTERKKEQKILEAEKARLQKILQLIKTGAIKVSAAELKVYEEQLANVTGELNTMQTFGTHESTKEDIKKGIQEAADYTIEMLNTVTEARVKMAEKAVEAANAEVEAAKTTLATEREAAAQGYANNQEMAQKELEQAKENQRKALAQQKKAQKQQQAVDTLTQISSLVTASASMWKDLGWPMALVGIATMWASFAASKIMAAKLAKQNTEQYGEGTVELLEGGSHASGNDIDLGMKADGTRRRAEGGEFFAVINKRNSRRYRHLIPDVINSLNKGTFNQKYMNAYDKNGMAMAVIQGGGTDVSGIESEVRRIREQGEKRVYLDGSGAVVIQYHNLTRRIHA